MGGDLEGVTQQIQSGYFTNLGVNALWLTPFNEGANGQDLLPMVYTKFLPIMDTGLLNRGASILVLALKKISMLSLMLLMMQGFV